MAEFSVTKLGAKNDKKIFYLVLDGVGGIPFPGVGKTALAAAKKPNIDALLPQATCGLFDPVEPGITPGSGPGHLGLFGYDPRQYQIGRGVLSALGVDFELGPDDVAARFNFCSLAQDRKITDRRAGRISTETNERLIKMLNEQVHLAGDAELFLKTVSEHRGLFVLRGKGLAGRVADTDPQKIGALPLDPVADDEPSQPTARLALDFINQAEKILAGEEKANGVLLRGFDKMPDMPMMHEMFPISCGAVATYPMYRGVARLVGMKVLPPPADLKETFAMAAANRDNYDYLFIHVKYTDKAGEDGNFELKVQVIEEVDALMPILTAARPDVLVITGDHSTPAALKQHSWHPVPGLLYAPETARPDNLRTFDEDHCRCGGFGRLPLRILMQLALAHAMKLNKFGA
ncbi:2,3-bisphosphoglycerate-independent phosphoglycerate mutase [Candidatus Zixiibacteriota bacterium]